MSVLLPLSLGVFGMFHNGHIAVIHRASYLSNKVLNFLYNAFALKLYLQLKTSYSSKEIWKMSNFPDIFMLTPLFSPIFISYHCWVQLPFLVDLPDDVELCFLKIKYVLSIYIQPHQVFNLFASTSCLVCCIGCWVKGKQNFATHVRQRRDRSDLEINKEFILFIFSLIFHSPFLDCSLHTFKYSPCY